MQETQRSDCGATFKALLDDTLRNYVPRETLSSFPPLHEVEDLTERSPRRRSSDKVKKQKAPSERASSEPSQLDPTLTPNHHSNRRPSSVNVSPKFRNIWETPPTAIRDNSPNPHRSSHPSPFSPSAPFS